MAQSSALWARRVQNPQKHKKEAIGKAARSLYSQVESTPQRRIEHQPRNTRGRTEKNGQTEQEDEKGPEIQKEAVERAIPKGKKPEQPDPIEKSRVDEKSKVESRSMQ